MNSSERSDKSSPGVIRARTLLPYALIAALGAAGYANSFDVPLQFDDLPAIVLDPRVHPADLSPEQLLRAASGFPFQRWLAKLTFALNYAIHGTRPWGYHAVNLVIHLASAMVLFAVARRLLEALRFADDDGRRNAALIAALLFVAHPVNTQAVTYVVQRMASLGALFGLLAVLCWLLGRARQPGKRWPLAAAGVVAWGLAVGCKENLLVVPVLILFLEWVVEPRFAERVRARWRAWAGAAALLTGIGVVSLWAYADLISKESARFGVPIGQRLLTQPPILFHYLSLLALPLPGRLRVDYSWAPSTGLLTPPSTLFALVGLAAVVLLALAWRRRTPIFLMAVGWFLIALSIEQSFIPLDLVFEQRLYFSAIGFFVLAGAATVRWLRVPRVGPWAVAIPLVLLLAAGTFVRNAYWRDPGRLYAAGGAAGPGAVRNLLNLGDVLQTRGKFDEAEKVIRSAMELAPDRFEPAASMGILELDRGRPAVAEQWFRVAIARHGTIPNVWHNLGLALERQARDQEALVAFLTALRLAPDQTRSRLHWALLTWRTGDRVAARRAVDEALGIDQGSVEGLTLRSQMRFEERDYAGSERDARKASSLAPERTAPREVLVRALVATGRTGEARQAAIELQRLAPGNGVAQLVLGAPR